jgi:hypothetical protein
VTSSGKPPVRRFNRFFNPCLKEEASLQGLSKAPGPACPPRQEGGPSSPRPPRVCYPGKGKSSRRSCRRSSCKRPYSSFARRTKDNIRLVLIAFAVAVYWVSHHRRRERRLDDLLSPDPLKDRRADGRGGGSGGVTASVFCAGFVSVPASSAAGRRPMIWRTFSGQPTLSTRQPFWCRPRRSLQSARWPSRDRPPPLRRYFHDPAPPAGRVSAARRR